jgi:hypothetical protein
MKRALALVALAAPLLWPAAGTAQPVEPHQRGVRCTTDGVLPAGVYWAFVGWYEEHLDCPRPAVALVEGVYRRGGGATRAVRRQRAIPLSPGYPWVVHTRYAGLEGDGVAVVLGLFESEDAARAWSASHRPGRSVDLRRVMAPDEALERFHDRLGGRRPDPIPTVTQVVGPGPVPAYRGRDLAQADPLADSPHERPRVARPVCRVRPGRVFVFDRDPRERRSLGVSHHRWWPVRCGGEIAWVEVAHTTAGAVTWSDARGDAYITQVTNVECDSPTHTTWAIDERWHRSEAHAAAGTCGPPSP